MKDVKLEPISNSINGVLEVPGDKSISHRAVMLGSLANGTTVIDNFLLGEDCLHTMSAFRHLGVDIKQEDTTIVIEGKGVEGLKESTVPLYFGNSGTTARLMIGILSGLPLYTTIYGDPFLTKRPMARVVTPLKQMGVTIDGRNNGNLLPLSIRGGDLTGIDYELPVKSAQVKSAVLLAGLFANGKTTVIEKTTTRDHTENMLKAFSADITVNDQNVQITNQQELTGTNIFVPGDISSAAFHLAAAAIVEMSELTIKNVGLNHTRTGIIDVLELMGAELSITNRQTIGGEPFGDVSIQYHELQGITIEGEMIPRLIDEIPIIALIATQANGITTIKNAEELKVKETDRLQAVVDTLSILGANIEATKDGMVIKGKTKLTGGNVSAYHDHRMAMMAAIASLICENPVVIDDISSVNVSYPNFFNDLQSIST